MKEVQRLELTDDLVNKYGIIDVHYNNEKIEIMYTRLDGKDDVITLRVQKRGSDTLNQLYSEVNGSMSNEALTHLLHHLNSKLLPIWDQVYNNNTNNTKEEPEQDPKEKRPPIIEEVGKCILEKSKFLTIIETDEIWYYKDGVYHPDGEILIKIEAEQMYGWQMNTSYLTQIIEHIKRQTYHKHEELDADINIINLKNGLYDINNNKLLRHRPAYLSIKQNPITYDPNAKPKRFVKFLQEVLYPRDILTAVDLIAYTFHRDYDIVEILFILLGLGRNGKTVFTSVLSALHGLHNVSNVPLTQMLWDRFALSDLENKDINIDNELAGQTIKETAVLKRLTGGSKQPVRIQRKNEKARDIIIYAKLVFCANKIPFSQDDSVAYHRRPIIISFPNTFDKEAEDPDLIKKLTTQQELSAIFNIAMRALRRIRKTNQLYINEKSVQERQEKYERAVNPIKAFVIEAISEESNESHIVSKTLLYGVYNLFCSKYALPVERYQNFCKSITNELDIRETRQLINDQRVQCWKGILLNPEYAPKTDQTTFNV